MEETQQEPGTRMGLMPRVEGKSSLPETAPLVRAPGHATRTVVEIMGAKHSAIIRQETMNTLQTGRCYRQTPNWKTLAGSLDALQTAVSLAPTIYSNLQDDHRRTFSTKRALSARSARFAMLAHRTTMPSSERPGPGQAGDERQEASTSCMPETSFQKGSHGSRAASSDGRPRHSLAPWDLREREPLESFLGCRHLWVALAEREDAICGKWDALYGAIQLGKVLLMVFLGGLAFGV